MPRAVIGAVVGCWVSALGVALSPLALPLAVHAVRLFLLAKPLLRAEPSAALRARSLARWSVGLAAVPSLLHAAWLAYVVFAFFVPRHDLWPLLVNLPYVLVTVLYVTVLLSHAALLRRASVALDAHHEALTVRTATRN
ncbi:MAG: hypothetical protein Q8Q09_01875 [Deltaproteobacteria bacterium]|nr:hypothetical protein [Deltaproteobacteria bacterium]